MASACAPSELVLVVHADLQAPEELDEVEIETQTSRSRSVPIRVPLGHPGDAGAAAFPLTLGLRPAGAAGDVVVEVRAKLGGALVVSQRARTSFVDKESRLLTMELLAACRSVTCPDGETCGATGCRGDAQPGASLPRWTGLLPAAPADTHDAGADAGPSFTAELADDFDDGVMDPFKWKIGVGPPDVLSNSLKLAEREGALRVEPMMNRGSPGFRGYVAQRRFDLRGALAVVEVPEVAQNGGQTVFSIDGPSTSYMFRIRWNSVLKRNLLMFEDTAPGSVSEAESYRPNLHRVWRFRRAEDDGLLHWETAPSPNGPFTVRRSASLPATLFAQVGVALYAGTSSGVAENPGAARFDNFALGKTQ
jgi:hypothetical protein